MDDMRKETGGGINVEIDAETAMGSFANFALISHSATEFIVDFAAALPGMPKPKVRSRIVLTPEHAKRLLLSLQENVMRYETTFGKITIRQQAAPDMFGKGEA